VPIIVSNDGIKKIVFRGALNISDWNRIHPIQLDKFKHDAVYFFKKNQYFLANEVHMNLSAFDYEERDCWSVSITYETHMYQIHKHVCI